MADASNLAYLNAYTALAKGAQKGTTDRSSTNKTPFSTGSLSQFNSFGEHEGPTISDPIGYFAHKDNSAFIKSLDPGPQPDYPSMQNLIDPNTGLLMSPYMLTDQFDNPYNQVLDQYRQKATLPEDQRSAAAQALQDQLGLATQGQVQSAIDSSAARAAEARGQQARQGGISSAIMANLNRSSQKDLNSGLQDIRNQSAQQALGITSEDLQNRQKMFENLLGEEGANRNFLQQRQSTNIGRALDEQNVQRELAQRKYEEQMKAWASGKQAQATASSGDSGGGKK